MTISTRILAAFFSLTFLNACGGDDDNDAAFSPQLCEQAASEALVTCLEDASFDLGVCYELGNSECENASADTVAAIAAAISNECDDTATRRSAFGPDMTRDALIRRVEESCRTNSASLASRTFGGPHGVVWRESTPDSRSCLSGAHILGSLLMENAMSTWSRCALDGDCNTARDDIDLSRDVTIDLIDEDCEDLSSLIAIDSTTYAQRALEQAECIAATLHPGTPDLDLSCGPRDSIAQAPRGEYVQIVLDSDVWGTRCGDGSPFAFQLRLAPDGSPVENLMVAMEGGGVCIFDDCVNRPADLFEALNDEAPTTGIMSNDPDESPFANWSKAYLPYCNQDVFIGGGATNVFTGGFTVHRFGAINVRAALRYIRDVIWRELDENTAEGYRPDRMRVFFGGFSAGGFGTLYNYHYVLDDLQWEHTTAFPDAALALDSGAGISVATLGALLIPESDAGWSSLPYMPPYCIDFDCGVGPVGLEAMLPRLKAVPEQQLLVLTNQVDDVQVATTFFDSTAGWVNELRRQYCRFADADGVKAYMPAIAESRHVISPFPDLYRGNLVDGVQMVDWLWGAVTDPDGVVNRVEEGMLVDAIPGVEPFPCEVAP